MLLSLVSVQMIYLLVRVEYGNYPPAIPVMGVICAFRYISTYSIKLSACVLVCVFLRLHYFLGEVFL